jgi:hypothetical protein
MEAIQSIAVPAHVGKVAQVEPVSFEQAAGGEEGR